MTSTPTPTWYDVLGVPRTASAEEIKSAWRHATDKFEPGSGSGQFRMFNDAADVLLDPARRTAYDATLDAAADTEAAADPVQDPPPPPPTPVDLRTEPDAEPTGPVEGAGPVARPAHEPASRRVRLLATVLGVLTVAALVLAGYFVVQVRRDAAIADAREGAPAAAERAAKAMLSYDYRELPADRKRAEGFLSDSYKKQYLDTFSLLEKNKDGSPGAAVQTKAVVTASVLGSGVVDAEADVARVLVYVNQVSQKAGADPQIFQNRVAMTMEKDGNRWLVKDLKSY